MSFTKGKVRDYYLLTTDVENIFINEYMPGAPGEYVKVYLYGLLYAQQGLNMSHETLAAQLNLTSDQVVSAWSYWESMGIVKRIFSSRPGPYNFDIEFASIREKMYGNVPSEIHEERASDDELTDFAGSEVLVDTGLKELYDDLEDILGRLLSNEEQKTISGWTGEGITYELIREAYRYCCGKGQTSMKYISKVIMAWKEKGLLEKEDILDYIKKLEERYGLYRKVLNSLGLRRNATSAEKQMIDGWVEELGFNEERILAACDTTLSAANPNLRYVNKVLLNWREEAADMGRDVNQKVTVTQAVLNKYYEFLRDEAQAKAEARRKEVYEAVPALAGIDQELTSLGSKLSRGLLSGMTRDQIEEARKQMAMLEEERAVLLTENNFAVDYTDIKYSCERCSDTGVDENGLRCSCIKDRTGEAEIWQNQKR
ncbi:MAG: DnaD domain protein [Firmicutes bacterium]|nr:DnaD domain protein [Bacillota bacterium]